MSDNSRCIECGSWEAQCSSPTPVKGCGCARCLSSALVEEKNMRIMAEKFHDVAIKERDYERHLVNNLRRELPQYNCQRTGGPVSDIGGRHCPLDNPCLTCRYEDLEMKRADCCVEMEQALEQVVPDWIGDDLIDIQACLRDCNQEFAIRLLRAKKALEKSREIKNELVDRVVHRDN